MSKSDEERIIISVRLPKKLLDKIEKYINANKPFVRDRTQVVEIALDKLFKEKLNA